MTSISDEIISNFASREPTIAEQKDILNRLMNSPGNEQCCDCGMARPSWCSTTLGTFLCLTCSGHHRNAGSHLSFVRSCTLDKFTRDQLFRLSLSGNLRYKSFLKKLGNTEGKVPLDSITAQRYREELDESVSTGGEGIDFGMGAPSLDGSSKSVSAAQSASNGTPSNITLNNNNNKFVNENKGIIQNNTQITKDNKYVSQSPQINNNKFQRDSNTNTQSYNAGNKGAVKDIAIKGKAVSDDESFDFDSDDNFGSNTNTTTSRHKAAVTKSVPNTEGVSTGVGRTPAYPSASGTHYQNNNSFNDTSTTQTYNSTQGPGNSYNNSSNYDANKPSQNKEDVYVNGIKQTHTMTNTGKYTGKSVSSADYFGENHANTYVPTNDSSALRADMSREELEIHFNLMAERAKETFSEVAQEAHVMTKNALDWVGGWLGNK